MGGQAPALADAPHVRVHDHPRLSEGTAQDDVGGLAANTVELQQLLHRAWHRAGKPLHDGAGHPDDRPRLLPVEPGRTDVPLELARVGAGEVLGGTVPRKERGRHPVHLGVCALRREDGGDQELQRRPVTERQPGDRIAPAQRARDRQRPGARPGWRLARGKPGCGTRHGPRGFRRAAAGLLPGGAQQRRVALGLTGTAAARCELVHHPSASRRGACIRTVLPASAPA